MSKPDGFTTSPGLILGTKLSTKITRVGSTSNKSNQRPAGLSNISGSNHCHPGRFFSFRTENSARFSLAFGLGREGGVMFVDTAVMSVELENLSSEFVFASVFREYSDN